MSGSALPSLSSSQPWEEEARDEGLGAIVGEHSLDLALESGGVAQAVALRLLKQCGIGRAVPQACVPARVAISWLLAARRFRVCTQRLLDGGEDRVERRSIGPGRTDGRHGARLKLAVGSRPTSGLAEIRAASNWSSRIPDGDRMRPLWQPEQ